MADAPNPPWKLSCPWCEFYLVVGGRGMHKNDPGAGVEAAEWMKDHIAREHPAFTWQDFLGETVIFNA
jgi:hypothetical protein